MYSSTIRTQSTESINQGTKAVTETEATIAYPVWVFLKREVEKEWLWGKER